MANPGFSPQLVALIQQIVANALAGNTPAQQALIAQIQQQLRAAGIQPANGLGPPTPPGPLNPAQQFLQSQQQTSDFNLLDILNAQLRRGGGVSRLVHGFQSFKDEGNLSGLGRAVDAIQQPLYQALTGNEEAPIHPFFLVVATRLFDQLSKKWEKEVIEPRWRAISAEFSGKIDTILQNMPTNEKIQKDHLYRAALARELAAETKAEETSRGAGYWLRGGVNL